MPPLFENSLKRIHQSQLTNANLSKVFACRGLADNGTHSKELFSGNSSAANSSVANSASTSSTAANGVVRSLQHCYYTDWSVQCEPAKYHIETLISFGSMDNAASFKIIDGYTIRAYQYGNFSCSQDNFSNDTSWFAIHDFSDALSSLALTASNGTSSLSFSDSTDGSQNAKGYDCFLHDFKQQTSPSNANTWSRKDALLETTGGFLTELRDKYQNWLFNHTSVKQLNNFTLSQNIAFV